MNFLAETVVIFFLLNLFLFMVASTNDFSRESIITIIIVDFFYVLLVCVGICLASNQ